MEEKKRKEAEERGEDPDAVGQSADGKAEEPAAAPGDGEAGAAGKNDEEE